MTPPREELARSIGESDAYGAYDREVVRAGESYNQEEELPPAEYTRSMLAKFRSIEDTSAPVPSPARSAQISSHARRSPAAVQQQHRQPVNRPSPDSGNDKHFYYTYPHIICEVKPLAMDSAQTEMQIGKMNANFTKNKSVHSIEVSQNLCRINILKM